MSLTTKTKILGIPADEAGYKSNAGWSYCECDHPMKNQYHSRGQIVQRFQKGHDNYDCPLCGAVMTSGKWSSKYDKLLQDVHEYMKFVESRGVALDGIDIWMEIKEDWCVIMVDTNDFEIASLIQYFGLHDSQKYGVFTEAYSNFRAMLTRDIER